MQEVIQIAGIVDQAEADLVLAAGVDYLGFPLRLKDGREDLSETCARRIAQRLPTRHLVAITYLDRAADVVDLCETVAMNTVQLHGDVSPSELERLRALRPDLVIFKSLVIAEGNQARLRTIVEATAPFVDAYLTDTFDPGTGRSGATGKTHDWRLSRELVSLSPHPVILAGGLTPANVFDAVVTVRPAGVDAHTGVEGADGRKDAERVRRFVAAAKRGFEAVSGRSL